MLWKSVLLVAIGGSAGAVLRFICQKYISQSIAAGFPWGTFAVNVSGCFLIGILYGYSSRSGSFTPDMRLLLMTGFCGGFTTFSAFTMEGLALLQELRFLAFLLYFAGSVVIGFIATFIGYWLTH